MMNRLLTYLVALLFVFALAWPAEAVEKKQSDKAKTAKVESSKKARSDARAKSTKSTRSTQRTATQNNKKYDSFVDRNGNGIDDRKERNRPAKKQTNETKVDPKVKTTEKSKKKD